jgi:hypothetical protein
MAIADRPPAAQWPHDQQLLDRLADQALSDEGLTVCCRLIMRYENTGPATSALARQAQEQLEAWGLDRRKAFFNCRKLWASGYRPALEATATGSGADVNAAA